MYKKKQKLEFLQIKRNEDLNTNVNVLYSLNSLCFVFIKNNF